MATNTQDQQSMNSLRCGVGVIALVLPLVLALGHFLNSNVYMQPTVSHFYYVPVLSDIMVGSMCAVGGFLIAYRGYENSDRLTSTVAGIAIIGVALFGTNNDPGDPALGFTRAIVDVTANEANALRSSNVTFELHPMLPNLHVAAAGIFFLALARMSYFEFTKTGSSVMTPEKIKRNQIYKITAYVILALTALLIFRYSLLEQESYAVPAAIWDAWSATFWIEAFAIWAFGIAWIIKGEAILADH